MRYFLAIFAVCVLATVGVLGFRGSHFRSPAAVYLPGHGAAAQTAARDGQCLLRRRHEFAPAGGGNDRAQPADPGWRQIRLSLAGHAGHYRPRCGHHQLCGA